VAPRQSTHAAIAGRERELAALTAGVRRLVRVVTNNKGDAAWTADAAAPVHAHADAHEPPLPARPPPRDRVLRAPQTPHGKLPKDPVRRAYKPNALPNHMTGEPPRAIGRATFDTPYEGPPGCVHGAVLAAAFDQVINVANILSGTAGPTATLSLEYEKPTPLGAPLVFEAWVDAVEGRKVTSCAEVRHEGRVTVRARGLFIAIDRERVMRLAETEPDGTR
jgi:acyl-coenzyme A thioesterase PaaI-like protein